MSSVISGAMSKWTDMAVSAYVCNEKCIELLMEGRRNRNFFEDEEDEDFSICDMQARQHGHT